MIVDAERVESSNAQVVIDTGYVASSNALIFSATCWILALSLPRSIVLSDFWRKAPQTFKFQMGLAPCLAVRLFIRYRRE